MGMFDSVASAEVTGGGVYFLPGKYRVRVAQVKAQRSQRSGKDFFVVECEILTSDNPERKAGSKASQVVDIGNVMGPVNIKAFVAAASGHAPDSEGLNEALIETWGALTGTHLNVSQICERVVAADNPLEGVEINLECANIKTRGTGKDFTKHFWSPVKAA